MSRQMMMVVAAIVVVCSAVVVQANEATNWALPANGASYAYTPNWPGTPGYGSPTEGADTEPPSLMNDEDLVTVIDCVNEIFAFKFDLGQDRQVSEIIAISPQWQWNTIRRMKFHIRAESDGPFGNNFDPWDNETQVGGQTFGWLDFDKGEDPWVATTGPIEVTARYVAVESDYSADHQTLSEIQILGAGTGPLTGDANLDGVVDDADLSLLLANWNQDRTGDPDGGWGKGEFDGTAPVEDADLSLLLANWTVAGAVPEPASVLLFIGGAWALKRRRTA